jgi:hypothetical protein
MATTTENIVFDTTINLGNSGNSIKSVKAELRQLNQELATLEPGSARFVEAATRAGELKDRIGDVRNAVDAFNPEGKFKSFAGAVGIAANGFSALQGAMAIFGSESESLNKTIAQTQGAIALATGLNGLLGMGDAFGLLAIQIKTNVVAAFASLKSALITTGIGALVIALGVLINEIFKYNDAVDAEIDTQKKFNEEQEKTIKKLEEVAAKTEKVRNARKGGIDEIKREINILEASGASAEKISNKKIELLEKELQNLKTKKYTGLDVEKDIADKSNEIEAAKLKQQSEIEKAKTDLRKKAAEKKKKEEEDEKKRQDDKLKEARSDYEFFQNFNQERDKKDLKKKQDEESEMLDAELSSLMAAAETSVSITKKEKEAKKKLSEEEVQHRLILNNAIASGLNTLSDLVGKNTVEGKLLAIASSTISTYTAIAGQLAAFSGVPVPGYAIVQAIATGVAGFAAVKNIIDTPVPGQGGGGGTVPNFTAPSIPQIPQSVSGTRLNQTDPLRTINEGRDSKVFVTETDITKTQNKVKNIIKKATIK